MFVRFPERKRPPSSQQQAIVFLNIMSKLRSMLLSVCTMHLHIFSASSSVEILAIRSGSDVIGQSLKSSLCSSATVIK